VILIVRRIDVDLAVKNMSRRIGRVHMADQWGLRKIDIGVLMLRFRFGLCTGREKARRENDDRKSENGWAFYLLHNEKNSVFVAGRSQDAILLT
jgi:hypothetical protein